MARPEARFKPSSLLLRIVSAVVLAPPVLAAIYFGTPYFEILIALGGLGLAWEWARLCGGGTIAMPGFVTMGSVVASLVLAALGQYSSAAWLIAVGCVAVALIAAMREAPGPVLHGGGVAYAGLPGLALLWLRRDAGDGLTLLVWMLLVVWATDIGAYFVGRAIGGPKLVPRLSPKKTWAGLIGGMVCAAAAGAGVAIYIGSEAALAVALVSALLALVAQTGDVFESGIKRHFGVKDSSRLIPGHGGLMDRVDGLVAVSLVVGAVVWSGGALF